ncbi:hypothetical protein CHR29_17925 [Pseudomonas monteilii]|nr:hypothetical protein CHR29_17925 [Pseudomonas monteilii]
MSSLLEAAPEEKRSAFYGVMADCGREKHDDGMIGDHAPNYLTFWSVIGCAFRGLVAPTKKPAEAGFLAHSSISHHGP